MRSRSMQSLTDAIKRRHPGVVVYGIGDAAHKLRMSDHNEDDTPGSLAAQSDADDNPEHRGIDSMLGPAFNRADAYALIADLLADPAALRRLKYIIFDGWIWSRSNGWKKTEFTGDDKHRDHPHISGLAADDENAAGWPAVEGADMTPAEAYVQHVMNYRLEAIIAGRTTYTIPAFKAFNKAAFTETNQTAVLLAELKARPTATADVDEAALAELLRPHLPDGVDLTAIAGVVRAEIDKTRLVGG